jgi:hypothetical protein
MSKIEVDAIEPQSGTTLTIGASGDTVNIASGATITDFTSTGIDDNATSTAITIDSSERVGIGIASPSANLEVRGASSNGQIYLGGSTTATYGQIYSDNDGTLIASADAGNNAASSYFGVEVDGTERMRITSNGSALFSSSGTNTVIDAGYKFQMRFTGSSDAGLNIAAEANANGTGFVVFMRSTSTAIGSISRNGTADGVNYNTSSDYRLKENVADMTDATTRLKQLQPKRFSWLSQQSDTPTQDGFIAHEVSSIVPEAITGTHNEVEVWKDGEELPEGVSVGDNKLDNDGNTIPKYQGIDQSKLVPLLVKTIQELEARITALENA